MNYEFEMGGTSGEASYGDHFLADMVKTDNLRGLLVFEVRERKGTASIVCSWHERAG